MIIMGIKSVGHDTGAAIIADQGDDLRIHAISEARLNRIKHSWRYPLLSMQYCLDALELADFSKIDAIYCDWHTGQVSQNISTRTPLSHDPHCDTVSAFNHTLHSLLEVDREKFKYCAHLTAHAASSYYLSPFDEATALVIDGGYGLYHGKGNTLQPIDANGYYDSWEDGKKSDMNNISGIGVLYEYVTTQLGFSGFDAGKTMALASFSDQYAKKDYYPVPESRLSKIMIDYRPIINWIRDNLPKFDATKKPKGTEELLSPYWVNLARQSQKLLEEDVLFIVKSAIEKIGCKNLAYSGGVALSCITNRKIFDSGAAENIFIQPSSSDEGIALGCALWGYYQEGGEKRTVMENSYLGKAKDPSTVPRIMEANGLKHRKTTPAEVAKLIADGSIIGRIAGASEYGPRALGNRSILADPRNPEMLNILNARIKHREGFRPFAPSVIYEKRNEYFDMPMEGPYMNVAASVRTEAIKKIPAVTHIDGSCRPQTVRQEQNPAYYALLEAFGKETGIYCLVNTSFNDNGEPIVETYDDAARTFRRTEIDYLYIENYLAWKPEGQSADRELPLRTEAHDEGYQKLIDRYADREILTEIVNSITLDDGKSAGEVCHEFGLLKAR
jgi:carbamoyltransferase